MSVFDKFFNEDPIPDPYKMNIQTEPTQTIMTDSVKRNRITGKIIKVHPKGYGFINSKEIEFTRIYFHWTNLLNDTKNFKELHRGMTVEFTPADSYDVKSGEKRGIKAIMIRVIE